RTWRFAGHTSPFAGSIVARVINARVATTGNVPGVALTLFDSSGNVLGGQTPAQRLAGTRAPISGNAGAGQAANQTLTDGPEEWGIVTISVDASSFQDTDIRGVLTSNGNGRLVSGAVYEIGAFSDTVNGYIDQQYGIGRLVLASDRQSVQ